MAKPDRKGKAEPQYVKHIKSVLSGIFTLAKRRDDFKTENPVREAAVAPNVTEAQETCGYSLDEEQTMLSKTRKGRAPVPVIRHWADRFEMHCLQLRQSGKSPIFANGRGNPLALGSLFNRVILPTLNRAETRGKVGSDQDPTGRNVAMSTCATVASHSIVCSQLTSPRVPSIQGNRQLMKSTIGKYLHYGLATFFPSRTAVLV
jgi:hypothetical protein